MKHTEIRAGQIDTGDIIKVIDFVYDETIKSKDWQTNFVRVVKYLRVDRVSNNGNTRAHDHAGKMYHVNVYMDHNFITAYRAA